MADLREQAQTTGAAAMAYRVLGALAVDSPIGEARLGGRRQQMVLAVLLSQPNRVISQDALVETVWNGEPPDSGVRVLHTYIWSLRKALGGGIERKGGGYRLVVDERQIDASRFEALVSEARKRLATDPEHASESLRRALGLWTGPPYGELGYEAPLIAEASRLAEARLAAHELRFDADLALGRHEEILSEIDALVRDSPYRERLAATLMLAQYRSGRQSEALRTYSHLRQTLIEELGIEPAPELQELELRILAQDPELSFKDESSLRRRM